MALGFPFRALEKARNPLEESDDIEEEYLSLKGKALLRTEMPPGETRSLEGLPRRRRRRSWPGMVGGSAEEKLRGERERG